MAKQITEIYARLAAWAFPVLIVILFFSVRSCSTSKDEAAVAFKNVDSLALSAKHFENMAGQVVAENKQLHASVSDLQAITDTVFKLREDNRQKSDKVTDYARVIQEGRFNQKLAKYITDTIFVPGDTILQPADNDLVRVPRPFAFVDSTISFAGQVLKNGVQVDSIRIQNTVHIRTVDKSEGFLNLKKYSVVQVMNSNPAITAKGVATFRVEHKPTWWQRWGKLAAGAILGGIGVSQIK